MSRKKNAENMDPVEQPVEEPKPKPKRDKKSEDFLQDFLKGVGAKEAPFGLRGAIYRWGKLSERHRIVRDDGGRVLYLKGNEQPVIVEDKGDLPDIT